MSELEPRVAALLKAERTVDPVAPAIADRLWERVSAGGVAAQVAGTAAASHVGTKAVVAGITAKTWLIAGLVAGSFIGGVSGYIVRGVVDRPVQKVVPVADVPTREPASAPILVEVPREEPAIPPRPPRAVSAPTPRGPGSDAQLAKERAVVDRVRTALQRGLNEEAIKTLEAAELEFRHGALVEERTALLVHALVESGQMPRARAMADTFIKRFPDSLMRPAVESDINR